MTADGHVVNHIVDPDDEKHWAKIAIDRMMAKGLALFSG
jgi:quinolinate synthase